MRYTFETFLQGPRVGGMHNWVLKDVSLSPDVAMQLIDKAVAPWKVVVTDNLKQTTVEYLTHDPLDAFLEGAGRETWKDASRRATETLQIQEHMKMWPAALRQPPTEAAGGAMPLGVKSNVSPPHYKAYFKELQWLETMQYLPNFRDPACFKAAVELQARKYIDRLGGKDFEPQELLKSIWYLRFLAAYIANGNKPILISDISRLID